MRYAAIILVGAILAIAAPAAHGDEVSFRDGRKPVKGVIVRQSEEGVVVLLPDGTTAAFKNEEVAAVEYSGVPESWIRLPRTARPPETAPDSGKKTRKPTPVEREKKIKPISPAKERRIRALLRDLASGKQADREQARASLIRTGRDAAPYLVGALKNSNYFVRVNTAMALGEMREKRAVRALIGELVAGTPERGEAAWHERSFLRQVNTALRKITGKSISYNPRYLTARKELAKWTAWWESINEDYPDQIGFPPRRKPEDMTEEEKKRAELEKEKGAFFDVERRRQPKPEAWRD